MKKSIISTFAVGALVLSAALITAGSVPFVEEPDLGTMIRPYSATNLYMQAKYGGYPGFTMDNHQTVIIQASKRIWVETDASMEKVVVETSRGPKVAWREGDSRFRRLIELPDGKGMVHFKHQPS